VNPEAGDTLARAVAEVNALPLQPDFIVLTGDLTHATDDPHERRRRMLAWLARDLTALDKDPPGRRADAPPAVRPRAAVGLGHAPRRGRLRPGPARRDGSLTTDRRLLLTGFAAMLVAVAARAAAEPRRIPVVARKFVFIPNEIAVRQGESVVLEFSAPELGLRALVVPGEVARVPFTADKAGRFDFLCDVFCGDGHEGMNGHLVVQA
jgi:cytochrome c oxidase subunit 2